MFAPKLHLARRKFLLAFLAVFSLAAAHGEEPPRSFSGIYPHLAYWNLEGECGTGAVVPWADRLWVITYGPHLPNGSSDKLYEIDAALRKTTRPESVGGTPANRLIHHESGQLFIGPYIIDRAREVRVIPPSKMFGRLTANARHLSDPANKIYYATMEEGIYEVDVKSLAVTELWADEQRKEGRHADLPGYHGKGLYSGQGRLLYANNGDHAKKALTDPAVPSGVLAEWDGAAGKWNVVRRNQFTDITGPGGIEGSPQPATDPVWSIGWDHRSLILMLLDAGKWQTFRLPKASHSYDGAHGWNTEWPRIRDIGEDSLLMTMHGAFWKFPKTFSAANTAGLSQRSTYLKVIGDFARWGERVVLGCDDAAKSEFLNKRAVKGALPGPTLSHSNLWFVAPETLDQLGPVHGTGAVWMNDPVKAGAVSDPYLFSGFSRRAALLAHDASEPVTFTIEVDRDGRGEWEKLREEKVAGTAWIEFPASERGAWVRVRTDRDCAKATALFTSSNEDPRAAQPDGMFTGLAAADATSYSGGWLHAGGTSAPELHLAAAEIRDGKIVSEGQYAMTEEMKLAPVAKENPQLKTALAVPPGVLQRDAASLLYVDDQGRRFRLPRGDAAFENEGAVPLRVCREICTERDLFHADGTFYELPAENAGGFAKVRPVATHRFRITDYCSWRGLLILAGLAPDAAASAHVIRSDDGRAAVWAGAVDDLWKLGRATGHGGPWKNTAAVAGQPSDAFLCRGFERKSLNVAHDGKTAVTFTVQADFDGTGEWHDYQRLSVPVGESLSYKFPPAFAAHWLRFAVDQDCCATAQLRYE